MMRRFKNVRWAAQGITAILLSSIAFLASGAEQMMRALPAPAVAQPVAELPAVQQIAAPSAAPAAVVVPAAISPVAIPPGQPTKPMSLNGPSTAPMFQKKLAPPSQGIGSVYVSPAAACGMNNTPRIGSINGRSSGGIVFQPGDGLNIAGCGFGKGGQVYLSGDGITMELKIESWKDSNIHAQINPAISGVTDREGGIKLTVSPNGTYPMQSKAWHSFTAARETIQVALPPELGIYSKTYGKPTVSVSGNFTTVERNSTYTPYCPPQNSQTAMVDTWSTDRPYVQGFKVLNVIYKNLTDQDSTDNDTYQKVLVGNAGEAIYDPAYHGVETRITVTFQGHSTYGKKSFGFLADNFNGPQPGTSTCTSRYTVSAIMSGPRGVAPFK